MCQCNFSPRCLLLPIICYSAEISCHLVSLRLSKATSLPMISFCLSTSRQRDADPPGKRHDSLWESSPVPPNQRPAQGTFRGWSHRWNHLLLSVRRGRGPRAWPRQSAAKLSGRSREHYRLGRAPDWETVGTAPALPVVFGGILGKMDPNPVFHLLKGG